MGQAFPSISGSGEIWTELVRILLRNSE